MNAKKASNQIGALKYPLVRAVMKAEKSASRIYGAAVHEIMGLGVELAGLKGREGRNALFDQFAEDLDIKQKNVPGTHRKTDAWESAYNVLRFARQLAEVGHAGLSIASMSKMDIRLYILGKQNETNKETSVAGIEADSLANQDGEISEGAVPTAAEAGAGGREMDTELNNLFIWVADALQAVKFKRGHPYIEGVQPKVFARFTDVMIAFLAESAAADAHEDEKQVRRTA